MVICHLSPFRTRSQSYQWMTLIWNASSHKPTARQAKAQYTSLASANFKLELIISKLQLEPFFNSIVAELWLKDLSACPWKV
jgi:hypothetical protein